jgi:hypothetical protein
MKVFFEVAPAKPEKCCNNCNYFSKVGVHLGVCTYTGKEKMDTQTCKNFLKK